MIIKNGTGKNCVPYPLLIAKNFFVNQVLFNSWDNITFNNYHVNNKISMYGI